MKASDKRKKAKGRYFMSGMQMRHAKWQESHMNSVAKRRGIKNPVIDNYVCGCGCGTVAFIQEDHKIQIHMRGEAEVTKKSKKLVAWETLSGKETVWIIEK